MKNLKNFDILELQNIQFIYCQNIGYVYMYHQDFNDFSKIQIDMKFPKEKPFSEILLPYTKTSLRRALI